MVVLLAGLLLSLILVIQKWKVLIQPVELFSSDSQTLVNLSHNAFHVWPSAFDANIYSPAGQSIFYLLVFTAGVFYVTRILTGPEFIESKCLAFTLSIISFYLIGPELVIYQSLCFFPFLFGVVLEALRGELKFPYVWVACFAVCLSIFSNQLSLFLVLTVLGLALYLEEQRRVSATTLSVLLVLVSLCFLLMLPSTDFPEYPLLARVVADDGIPGMLRPLFGQDANIPILDREFIVSAYLPLSLSLAFVYALFFLYLEEKPNKLFYASLFFLVILAADVVLPEQVRVIMPLAALQRVIPGGIFYVPLHGVLFILSLLFAFLFLIKTEVNWLIGVVVMVLIQAPVGQRAFGEFYKVAPLQDADRAIEDSSCKQDLANPSYAVVKKLGAWAPCAESRIKSSKFSLVKQDDLKNIESSNPKNTEAIFDSNLNNRWSSGSGAQVGGEFLELEFKDKQELSAVELFTAGFPTDFPRGIRVLVGKKCDKVVYEDNNWMGPPAFTEDGLLYFLGQDQVRIFLPKSVKTRCLKVEQISQAKNHDWSVTGIGLAN